MNFVVKGCAGFFMLSLAGGGLMYSNFVMQQWPPKKAVRLVPTVMHNRFPFTDVALKVAKENGLALASREGHHGELYTHNAVRVEVVNHWLVELAAQNITPHKLWLRSTQREGEVMVDNVGFDK